MTTRDQIVRTALSFNGLLNGHGYDCANPFSHDLRPPVGAWCGDFVTDIHKRAQIPRPSPLARILASAMLATTISTLAACGNTAGDPGKADPRPVTAAPAVPPVESPPSSAHPAPAPTGTLASPSPIIAVKHSPAQPSPHQQSTPAAVLARFGHVTSEDSTASIDVSPDRAALTAVFADLEVDLERGAQSAGTRMVMPLTSGAQHAKITIYASGYAFTDHATARLSLTVNGRTVVEDFPAGTDTSFVQPIELPVIAGSKYQLSLALEGYPAPGSDGTAYLNVSAIDAEITPT